MVENALKLLFLLVGVVIIYKLIFAAKSGRTLLEMKFRDGKLISHSGKIQEKFERDIRALAKKEKLTCTLRAERKGHVRLHISANSGDHLSQRIRNLFPFEYYEKKQIESGKISS